MRNPVGEGVFVYRPQGQQVLNVNRRFLWLVVNGLGYALNGPSKGVTPSLPWPREAPDAVWATTGLERYDASQALRIVFDE
jgi:hypothetical protein